MVSIHAPTRGATFPTGRGHQIQAFQSTHPHGVRQTLDKSTFHEISFNPRTHTGCDTAKAGVMTAADRVSIHAPTRGATFTTISTASLNGSFNPRTHTGCDLTSAASLSKSPVFQSTHPHGVRPKSHVLFSSASGFNPRTHTGCDVSIYVQSKFTELFQSTHPHGVRLDNALKVISVDRVSIHAPTRGATMRVRDIDFVISVSIHAPTRGATYQGVCLTAVKSVSIHAPTRGATWYCARWW